MSPHSINDKLIHMANQIGTFFLSQDEAAASGKIAKHIPKFWDRRMRKAVIAHLDAGEEGLSSESRPAIVSLRESQPSS